MISDKKLINTIYDRFYVEKIFDRESYRKNAANEVHFISSIFPMTVKSHVLDMACGIGLHANEVACRGCQTVGVDLSSACIELAKKKFDLPNLEFFEVDAKEYAEKNRNKFDLVMNLGMSFGYSLQKAQNDEELRYLARPIRQGGYLVIQNLSKACCIKMFKPSTSFWRETDDHFILDRREMIHSDSMLRSTKIFVDKPSGLVHRYEDTVALYEIDVLTNILEKEGLEYLRGFHSFDGEELNETESFLPILLYRKNR